MKILVVSDSHHNEYELEQILKHNCPGCSAVFHLGDGCDDMLAFRNYTAGVPEYLIKGNCDRYSPVEPCERIITTVGGKKIFACHGHRYSVKERKDTLYYAALQEHADICLYGHTHIRSLEQEDGMIILNPGSAADGEFAIIDICEGKAEVTLFG